MIERHYAVDYQVHSVRSHDGKFTIDQMCQRAIALGLDEIGFTEHKDFDPDDPVVEYFDYQAYMHDVTLARMQYGSKLKVRAGIEIDYQVWFEDKIGKYLETHKFDFVMGCVHYVNKIKVMSPEYNRNRNARLAYSDYFHAVRDSVLSGLFDVLGHMEYANRAGVAAWGKYDSHAHHNDLVTIFDRMVEEDMVLEINTAGLFHGIGATYPCDKTLELYASRGGTRISIGSDAHHPDQLGGHYLVALEMAKAVGINSVVTWDKRHPTVTPFH